MSAYPIQCNPIHVRVQRKHIEMHNEICDSKVTENVNPILTQEAIAVDETNPNALPTIHKYQVIGHHGNAFIDRWFQPEGAVIDLSEALRSSHNPLSSVMYRIPSLLNFRVRRHSM
ncbi:hypothetical protein PMAYCL1PPCAC_32439 [Pristionchus mayeri]|uniref:Uncharacterized protein n=1 Tax=Pristionchus mayeri TaxID=1317129 RepID=A0AAN5DHW3_9BILA|nr:hypothetical protein PMAYCL1PPCAC_32439 [Pristionchus mayeri]